jgi:hypothetical protein
MIKIGRILKIKSTVNGVHIFPTGFLLVSISVALLVKN